MRDRSDFDNNEVYLWKKQNPVQIRYITDISESDLSSTEEKSEQRQGTRRKNKYRKNPNNRRLPTQRGGFNKINGALQRDHNSK